ncbi:hypothetical protein [Entomobacter blattae]|uniref:Uncharacterized protein n=1 Tax=Entomobacter blattae TaxID=2762277 RepID=A0A7H1NTI0_9PROT|nr:hypothetical protein [Entomobacter blattae]QNT79090.1 hypothetical protein JGUZn3_18760 [Entomobacter blattae]
MKFSNLLFYIDYITGMDDVTPSYQDIQLNRAEEQKSFSLRGWGFVENTTSERNLYLAFLEENNRRKPVIVPLYPIPRSDVKEIYPNSPTGIAFEKIISSHDFSVKEAGRYHLVLMAYNPADSLAGCAFLNWSVEVNNYRIMDITHRDIPLETQKYFYEFYERQAHKEWVPVWEKFDEEWYMRTYPLVKERMQMFDMTCVEEFYREIGSGLGHSPNPYFDEVWYAKKYPDIYKKVLESDYKSGFIYYCLKGYEENHSPTPLFYEDYYLAENTDLTKDVLENAALSNGYEHFILYGDRENRRCHYLYDSRSLEKNLQKQEIPLSERGPYTTYRALPVEKLRHIRPSVYFDPEWYEKHYPEVKEAIAHKHYDTALQHYLENSEPMHYSPLEWFDEGFYLQHNPDIVTFIHSGVIRNGYEHFLRWGAKELRQPCESVNLQDYYHTHPEAKEEIDSGVYKDIFARWLVMEKGVAY